MTDKYLGWKPGGWTEQVLILLSEWSKDPIDRIAFQVSVQRKITDPEARVRKVRNGSSQTKLSAFISRVFHRLAREGIIERDPRFVRIIDRPRLLEVIEARNILLARGEVGDVGGVH